MKFVVTGASGFMGGHCVDYLRKNNHEVYADRLEITDYKALESTFKKFKPDVVINFAGVRAYPNIDWCEDHKLETVAVNVAGALNVARAALEVGAYPMMVSSGCIYNGGPDKEFTEEDEPNFTGSFYSRMRIALQNSLKELPVLTLRVRMPLSSQPNDRNLITKIVGYEKVISVPNSVTLIEDMYPAMEKLAHSRPVGILNFTNEGYLDHKTILDAYKEIVNPNHTYTAITLEQLEGKGGITKAKRSNCILSTTKLKSLGIEMPAIDKQRMRKIMEEYRSILGTNGMKKAG